MEDHSGAVSSAGGGGDVVGFDLEDAELTGAGGGIVAQWAFGEAGTRLAGCDELARELDQVGGNGFGRGGFPEGRIVAKGDLFIEQHGFFFVGRGGDGDAVGDGRRGGGAAGVLIHADGIGGGGDLCGGKTSGRRLRHEDGAVGGHLLGEDGGGDGGGLGGWERGFKGDGGDGRVGLIPVAEIGEELLLGAGNGAGVDAGDFGGGFGLMEGAGGLFGEDGAVAGGVGVALRDGGGDGGGAGAGGGSAGDFGWWGSGGCSGDAGATGAMGGEALGDLLLEGERLLDSPQEFLLGTVGGVWIGPIELSCVCHLDSERAADPVRCFGLRVEVR